MKIRYPGIDQDLKQQLGIILVTMKILPAPAVMDLEILMPSGVSEKILEQGISIRAISESSIRNGYQPGTLFESHADGKLFRVWIE